jgi:hypothetical protein
MKGGTLTRCNCFIERADIPGGEIPNSERTAQAAEIGP